MNLLTIAVLLFLLLETANVVLLYFFPDSKKGNGVGIFNAYEKTKKDPELHAFVTYLINWVAGTKLIFIALLIVILITGNLTAKLFSVAALVLSIGVYFWRLHPLLKKMDAHKQLSPVGYSKQLGIMIATFMIVLTSAIVLTSVL